MCTKTEALTILEEVFDRSKNIFGASLVKSYLYGSYARGDYDSESDVDILLIVALDMEYIRNKLGEMNKIDSDISLSHNITVSVTVRPLEQFEKYSDCSPFYINILSEGISYAGK